MRFQGGKDLDVGRVKYKTIGTLVGRAKIIFTAEFHECVYCRKCVLVWSAAVLFFSLPPLSRLSSHHLSSGPGVSTENIFSLGTLVHRSYLN